MSNQASESSRVDTTGCSLEMRCWHDRQGFSVIRETVTPEEWAETVDACEKGDVLDVSYRLVDSAGRVVAECCAPLPNRERKEPPKRREFTLTWRTALDEERVEKFDSFLRAVSVATDAIVYQSGYRARIADEREETQFAMEGLFDDFRFFPEREGTRRNEDGSFWARWYVFRDEEVARVFAASTLAGYSQGPGRAFANRPQIRVGKYRTRVLQTGGRDI